MRPRQAVFRLRRPLPPVLLAIGTGGAGSADWHALPPGTGLDDAPQSGPQPPPHESGEFRAVGHARPAADVWREAPDPPLLFLFHLHEFAALAEYAAGGRTAEGDEFWRRVVEGWLARFSRPGHPAWHPYPTSGRVVAWAAAVSAIEEWPEEFRQRVACAVRRQAGYLARCVEHDIGGNHVLRNAWALVVSAIFLRDDARLGRSLRLLGAEVGRQFLPDGGHEERSPSYHRRILAELADVDAVLREAGHASPQWLGEARQRGHAWLGALAGPDGQVPLLNDAWEGPPLAGAESRPDGLVVLADSGYTVCRHGGDHLVADRGLLAPAHLPPHAHADALSFVLWGDGRPVVVDPGAYAYAGSERDEFRGTAAHSTVAVDGRDQCDLWGPFRIAHPPRVEAGPIRRYGDLIAFAGRHDGYRRLPDAATHTRHFVWWPGIGLVVIDFIESERHHRVDSRIHLAPGRDAGSTEPFAIRPLDGEFDVEDGWYAPHLGRRHAGRVLVQGRAVDPGAPFGWSILRPGARVSAVSRDAVELEAGGVAQTAPLEWVAA